MERGGRDRRKFRSPCAGRKRSHAKIQVVERRRTRVRLSESAKLFKEMYAAHDSFQREGVLNLFFLIRELPCVLRQKTPQNVDLIQQSLDWARTGIMNGVLTGIWGNRTQSIDVRTAFDAFRPKSRSPGPGRYRTQCYDRQRKPPMHHKQCPHGAAFPRQSISKG